MTRICKTCGIEKPIGDFYSCSKNPNWHHGSCKSCDNRKHSSYSKEYRKTEQGKAVLSQTTKRYHKNHPEKQREYRQTEGWKSYVKEYRKSQKYKQQQKEWAQKRNKERRLELNAKMREYREIPQNKIKSVLRCRIYDALRAQNATKYYKLKDVIGCDIEFLKEYLTSLFQDGMTWDNHGRGGWHVDHIIPCSAFDLTDIEQQRKCFHYTNLQPLWEFDNLSKHDKIIAA